MVFVPAKRGEVASEFDVSSSPEEYVLSLLDGSNTVKSIKKSCCLCEYKVYESINILLQAQRITALQQKHAQPIQAALKRKEAEEASALGRTFLGSMVSVGVAAAFALFFLFCKTSLLPALTGGDAASKQSAANADAVRAASMLYRAVSGEEAENTAVLKKVGLLRDRDLKKY
jgi:hypothetical protein